jgi:NifB/MoaA-like Fe-S oxidoreductase
VHATNHDRRKILLNSPRVPDVLAQLTRLAEGGIRFHCQVVIVPEINDSDVLEESLRDLWAFGEHVLTTAVVPVGLTQFSHLYTGKAMDQETASTILDQVEKWGERARVERGHTWVYGSDELYLLATRELPAANHYGDFAQIENGVGSVTALRERVRGGLGRVRRMRGARVGVVTGKAMAPLLPALLSQLAAATGARFELIEAESSLFGPTITTAGLLVGADIRRALTPCTDLDLALIPAETLNDDQVFLDDDTYAGVQAALPMPIYASYDFIDVLERADLKTASGSVPCAPRDATSSVATERIAPSRRRLTAAA